jgi:LacI family transcriptional regulator, repressor for deo operon, udp, cdd, tsx, nupC, and nupG
MVGIEDVAKLAGVSTATVSRALSGKDHVSQKARDRVNKAATELGYVASSSAYTLATGRNRNIGVVMPQIDRWFFSTVLETVETVFIEHGYDLTLYNLSGGQAQRAKVFSDFLLRKRVDAVLTIAVRLSEDELARLAQTRKPYLGIGGALPGASTLAINDFEAGKLATQHLLNLGHTRIGVVGEDLTSDREFDQPKHRQEGYLSALAEANLTFKPHWFCAADYTIPAAYHAAKQILGHPTDAPTALFCKSDEMAFGAILAAKDLGLRVPEDVSIVGVDNHDLSEFFGLTTINQDVRAQARHAALELLSKLEDHIEGTPESEDRFEVWPTTLLIRNSTARRPAEAR